MKRTMSRAEFLRVSSLGIAGITAAGVVPAHASSSPSHKAAESIFHPQWKSVFTPDFKPRLSDSTRELAFRGLSGEWGRTMSRADWDTTPCLEGNPGPQVRYGRAAILNAKNAPLRVIPNELLVCSSTLEEATEHKVPGMPSKTYSISHTTLGFERAMNLGYNGLRREILERQARGGLDAEAEDLLQGMLLCIDAATIWNNRHIEALRGMLKDATEEDAAIISRNIDILSRVPENPPRNFREALQCLWSMWEFNRFMGNWSGIGRFDKMLGGYLQRDLRSGAITMDEAREAIAHFWIKGTGWITNRECGSGDAQFYQNIVLGGIDKDGNEVTNEVTYLVLDVVEELHISDFPIAVRVNDRTPEKLIRRMAEVQRHGGGIVSMYNEKVVIDAMTRLGYPLEEAREFSNDGCWETIIPGKTFFEYTPRDMVAIMNSALGTDSDGEIPEYATFEDLYSAFLGKLKAEVDRHHAIFDKCRGDSGFPCALASLFVEGCVEKGRSYDCLGPVYTVHGLHYGGISDVANSLYVIKKLVYEENYLSLGDFIRILRDNWDGKEPLRQLIKNRFVFFGNDDDEADAMVSKVFNDYSDAVNSIKKRDGIIRHGAISTFGREVDWKDKRAATAEGSRRGDILATNCSPTPGTDRKGPTAALNSYCKLDFSRLPNGGTLELKILPQSVQGENGIRALMGLTKSFRDKGGFYMHIDVVDSSVLIDAQMHPEKYPNLPVRVAGWSARFTTLCKDWQDMVIQRTQQII